jgi:zinc transporter ZupT
MGIANSFAAGVFIAIALIHILPEAMETWDGIAKNPDHIFPLPTVLVVTGYTLILVLDKVLFDTHALFSHDDHDDDGHHEAIDPAEKKFRENLRASFANIKEAELSNNPESVRRSMIQENANIEKGMKEFLNPQERFAARMKASLRGSTSNPKTDDQKHLFVDGAIVNHTQDEGRQSLI